MVSLDFTAVLFTLSFIVFLGLMKLCFFDPIARVINKREKFIADNLQKSRSIQERIQEEILTKNPSTLLTKAKEQAHTLVSEALAAANTNKQKFLDDNKIKLQSTINTSLEELNRESDKIRANIDNLITEIVTSSVDKLLNEIQRPKAKEALKS